MEWRRVKKHTNTLTVLASRGAQDKNFHGEAGGTVEVICCTNGAQDQGESNKRKERKEAGELGKKIK